MRKSAKRIAIAVLALLLVAGASWAIWQWIQPKPDFADQRYADRSSRNILDLYRPSTGRDPVPVVLWIHGGGFEMGSKASPEGLDQLRAAGFAVASMSYRYSSEAHWPAQRDDVASAIRYLRANASRLGIDPQRIGVWGASAGGNLAATAGIALAAAPDTRVQAAVDWFGPIDFSLMDADMAASGNGTSDTLSADSPESRLIGATVGERPDLARAASPREAITRLPTSTPLPPFLIMHGAKDPLIAPAQSQRLAAALRARGGSVQTLILPNGTHGGGDFREEAATRHVVDFFVATLRPAA